MRVQTHVTCKLYHFWLLQPHHGTVNACCPFLPCWRSDAGPHLPPSRHYLCAHFQGKQCLQHTCNHPFFALLALPNDTNCCGPRGVRNGAPLRRDTEDSIAWQPHACKKSSILSLHRCGCGPVAFSAPSPDIYRKQYRPVSYRDYPTVPTNFVPLPLDAK